ncbi:MAG: hypothetical protein MUE40_18745 [Anaerolineae bacterium]|jgi:hypothetical protein|nr:hypothetical protein [Anaerolineae bacterium]
MHIIDAVTDDVQPALPVLIRRLALTYVPLMLVTVLIATVGGRLLNLVLPLSTATLLALCANVLVLVYGWRRAERRFLGTKLFVLYTAFSRERRELRRLLAAPQPDAPAVEARTQQMQQTARVFVEAARAMERGD